MIIKKTLENGLRILMERIPYVRSASVGVWVGNGSRYETAENNGISHFIEHMLFKGTEHASSAELARQMDALGGQFNAFTTKECTSFYFRALDTDLAAGIRILGDMLTVPLFPENELAIERGVIGEEIDMYEDTPDELVMENLFGAVYQNSPLGFPIIGTRENLAAMHGDTLRSYMQTHYVAENIVVGISGNFDEATEELLCETFAKIPRAPVPVFQPAQYAPASVTRKKPIEQNHICLGFRGIPIGDPDRYAAQIFSCILGGGMSSRLFQKIREENGLCYSVYAFQSSHAGTGVSGVYVATNTASQSAAIDMIRGEIEELIVHGPTEEEVTRTCGQTKANVLMSLESTVSRMNHMARSELMLGYVPTPEEIIAAYDAVDMAACRRAAEKLFDYKTLATSVVGNIE